MKNQEELKHNTCVTEWTQKNIKDTSALDVTADYTKDKKRIALRFSTALPTEETTFLKGLGFVCRNKESMSLWDAPVHPAYLSFAENLAAHLHQHKSIIDAPLHPSFAPTIENIERKKFSYISLLYEENDSLEKAAYVVFDSYQRVAYCLAQRFAQQKYGAKLRRIEVEARLHKAKARKLLATGAVIGTSLENTPQSKAKDKDLAYPSTKPQKANSCGGSADDGLHKVVAHMHNHYIDNIRLSKKKIEQLGESLGITNQGKLWEAVELSWLLWYKQLYAAFIPFDARLQQMVCLLYTSPSPRDA